MEDTKTVDYCAQHVPDEMVDVKSRNCITEGCSKQPSLGVAGTETAEYCSQHAPDRIVDVKKRKYLTKGCGKRPLFEVAGTKTGGAVRRTPRMGW